MPKSVPAPAPPAAPVPSAPAQTPVDGLDPVAPATAAAVTDLWKRLCVDQQDNLALSPLLQGLQLESLDGNQAVLRPKPGQTALLRFAQDPRQQAALGQHLSNLVGRPVRVVVEGTVAPAKTPAPAATAQPAPPREKPPDLREVMRQPRAATAATNTPSLHEAMNLPLVRQFMDLFPQARIKAITPRVLRGPETAASEPVDEELDNEPEDDR